MKSQNRRKNPVPTVDIIIEMEGQGIVLIERKNEPHGWAIPGGYVDYGESFESAAIRVLRLVFSVLGRVFPVWFYRENYL